MAHVRAKFYYAELQGSKDATKMLNLIAQLYELEKEYKKQKLGPEATQFGKAALAKLPQDSPNAPELITTEGQQIVQIPLAQISWYHHISLLSKVDDPLIQAYYILRTAQEGWSRDIMMLQIADEAHLKQGMAITNFTQTLPPAPSTSSGQAQNYNHNGIYIYSSARQ